MSSSPSSPSSPTSPGNAAPVQEGDILASKYRVEKVLGVGGMGVVVAAEHIELAQKVALKFLLKQAAANEALVGRFLREARASVRLKGAHVAKTLDVGRLEDGAPYIVMEFLDGHDLHAEIRAAEGPLPIETAVSYVVQAAEGLAEAHSLGIVHRDLKPGNLFLTRGVDGRPLVKVLDFGISKTMDPSIGGDGLSLTNTSMLLGSPLYMSPEQMRSSKHVDERSDLWALGAIAFELLTGRVPFEADTILELCFKVAQEKAPNPITLRADLPHELCEAVMKCLEKDPGDRFANVGELAQAFEPFALTRDRGTAERALDVLGTGKRPPMRSLPVVAASAPTPPATPAPIAAAARGVPQSSPSQAEAVAPAAWGTTQAHTTGAKSKKGIVAAVGGVVVIAALAGTMLASRSKGAEPAPTTAGSAMPSAANANANANANASGADASAAMSPSAVAAAGTSGASGPAVVGAASGANASGVVVKSGGRSGTATASSVASAASAASAKGTKPGASSAASGPAPVAPAAAGAPTTDPAGFIKVRE
jgi:serine/threonine protein kinase